MTKQNRVDSGKASKKPTKEDIEKKREALKAKLRQEAALKGTGITNIQTGINEKRNAEKAMVKKTISKKAATAGASREVPRLKKDKFAGVDDIPKRNHTYRISRMGKVFGPERVQALKDSCRTEDDFKWELYQAEQRQELTVKEALGKKANGHIYDGAKQGANPISFEWHGETYEYDEKSKFKPEYLDLLMSHLQANGSVTSFCFKHKIVRDTFNSWARKYPCVRNALEWGRGGTLELYEKVSHAMAVGMDTKKFGKSFTEKPNHIMLQGLLKNKFREEYHEKYESDNADLKDIASLTGNELANKVKEIRERQNRLETENPFGKVELYKGE